MIDGEARERRQAFKDYFFISTQKQFSLICLASIQVIIYVWF